MEPLDPFEVTEVEDAALIDHIGVVVLPTQDHLIMAITSHCPTILSPSLPW